MRVRTPKGPGELLPGDVSGTGQLIWVRLEQGMEGFFLSGIEALDDEAAAYLAAVRLNREAAPRTNIWQAKRR